MTMRGAAHLNMAAGRDVSAFAFSNVNRAASIGFVYIRGVVLEALQSAFTANQLVSGGVLLAALGLAAMWRLEPGQVAGWYLLTNALRPIAATT